tara:strand:+ start:2463 stop:3596 length:1134 start_codon:yes stop_codon:yes gene_type:complete
VSKYKIAWLPGDGVGPELAGLAKRVLNQLGLDATYINGDIGWDFWKSEGNPLPSKTRQIIQDTDCAFMVAITSKPQSQAINELEPSIKKEGIKYISPILTIRQDMNLHTNIRPCKSFTGNRLNYRDGIDITIIRENTEGLYSGVEFFPVPGKVFSALNNHNVNMNRFSEHSLNDLAISTRICTRKGCRSIVYQAFEYAKKNNNKSVTLVDKPNVLRETGQLMSEEARKIAKEYPEINFSEANMDAMCMWIVKNPEEYDVLVAENMFGDILSDLAAQLVGGLGFVGSANIGDDYALFEPCHGSVPKYKGQNKVNPIATFLSLKMMLDWLGEKKMANNLENAISKLIKMNKYGTYDMGLNNNNIEITEHICNNLKDEMN